MGKFEDLSGQKFGRLLVIERAPNKGGRTSWYCKCDCGNEIQVISKSLKDGNTKSCGCLHKEMVSKNFSKNIAGQRFGNLIAIEATEERRHGSVVWKCQCDCGNTHLASAELLLNGHCKSCGCIRSRGNQKIKEILQNMQINFIAEYRVRINNINYYYDFAIIENDKIKCLIEYDGELHFEYQENRGWNNKENWEKTHRNDQIKNQYATENNISLIRIPYFDYDKLTINYIKEKINV